jgi:hypothetical protein
VINDNGVYNDFVRYRKSNHVQIPYIEIKSGGAYNRTESSIIRINTDKRIYRDIDFEISLNGASPDDKFRTIYCRRQNASIYDDKVCFGCSMRYYSRPAGIKKMCKYVGQTYIRPSDNVVAISQGTNQKETFTLVAEIVDSINNSNQNANIKVWCEGHLPIRRIRVGNTRRKTELTEIIEHYCRHSECFWLKYVDVEATEIPFRSALKFD